MNFAPPWMVSAEDLLDDLPKMTMILLLGHLLYRVLKRIITPKKMNATRIAATPTTALAAPKRA